MLIEPSVIHLVERCLQRTNFSLFKGEIKIFKRMWTREMTDLLDVLPYYLLVALPVFIILSPINPVDAASELDVHRLAQFELAGNTHGSKQV